MCSLLAAVACGGGGSSGPADAGAPDATPVDPTIAIFDPDRLLNVEITMAPADWDALRFEHHDLLAALGPGCQSGPTPRPYNFYSADVSVDGVVVKNVGVRMKGFLGSVTAQRPSLKVKFGEYVVGQELSGLSRLTLNNNNQDQSQVNACIAYAVFRSAGVPAPRCNFARVSVNGQDLGIYSNVEGIKKRMLRRHFTDDTGNLYEGVASDFRDQWMATFQKKTNTASVDRSDIAAVTAALARPDSEVVAALEQVVDLDAFLSFWATEVLIGHWDGYAGNINNFFLYGDPTSGMFHFIPWGADAVLGDPSPFPPQPRPTSVEALSALPWRLYLLPETQARYRDRLRQILASYWDETALLAEVDRMEALVKPYIHVSGVRFQEGLSRVRTFIMGRRAALDAELSAAPPEWIHPLRGDPCLVKIGQATATFDTTWEDPFPPDIPFGRGAGTFDATLGATPVSISGHGYVAGPSFDVNSRREGIMAAGVNDDDSTLFGLYLGVDPELYGVGTLPVDMYTTFGTLLGGQFGAEPTLRAFAFGTLTLTAAGTANGEAVTGSVTVEFWGAQE